ncbi:MAG: hypothetical protein A2X13_02430 [Bacteroidetes bacterium GWC2_33_15]|nr:MAG: hypothetical protein A2X10_14875 [Bacteroidetes bacterium GWA2_33_15]OFX49352.1 MAG: hypothetical protein A2X13_02430 [Bacteroidetes bacterium GWC2_33_15]OFX63055.1 MAG: hypothetical protein A2X15_10440 [Bacteroidetes bacterium GWB2_32_14]OFX68700.1 MAG: hypothetical protein A2X14_13955 [Bacteroidetes bacterium GWD2_33_33]HAN19133.1 hypothetical protein [Bacteroidales bacterium]
MELKTDNIQEQINQINQKLDLVLHYVNEQRLKSEAIEDLVSDLSIIGKDAFTSAIEELDKQGIELNVDDLKTLVFKFIRNINNFSQLIDMFESLNDLAKDMGPIITEVGIDFTNKLHEFEQKGYFEFLGQMAKLFDNAVVAYNKTTNEPTKQYSLWRIMREINSPEVKQSIGFMLTLLKNMSQETKSITQ